MPIARAETSCSLAASPETHRSLPRWCWDYVRQMLALAGFFVTGLVVSPVCALLLALGGGRIPPEKGQRLIRWLFRTWIDFSSWLGVFEIRFSEVERLSQLRGTLIAANHPSVLDAVLLLAVIPRTVCIMRANLARSPFVGGAARLAGYVTNDSGPALVRQGVACIQRGDNLLIFPEGTRTRDGAMNPFKNGFALIAARARVPIQTVFIERESRYLGKGVSFFSGSALPLRYELRLGGGFHAEDGESAAELAARMEDYFRRHLRESGTAIRFQPSVP